MDYRIPDGLFRAIIEHLSSPAQIKIVLHFAEQRYRYKNQKEDKWDWTTERNLLDISGVAKPNLYRSLKNLVEKSVLFSEKRGRRTFYQVNENFGNWGAENVFGSPKVKPIIGNASVTNRYRQRYLIGNASVTSYITGWDSYSMRYYSPSPDLKISLSKIKAWPAPLLKNPDELEKFIKKETASWPLDFMVVLATLQSQKHGRLKYLHPDDIQNTILALNRLQLKSRDEYWAYCIKTLEKKWNDRLVKIDLEIHEMRKRGEL